MWVWFTSFNESFDNFFIFQSESCCDAFKVYDGPYNSKTQLKRYGGAFGDISYEWSGDAATFWWKTDESQTRNSMTAYIDFWKKVNQRTLAFLIHALHCDNVQFHLK